MYAYLGDHILVNARKEPRHVLCLPVGFCIYWLGKGGRALGGHIRSVIFLSEDWGRGEGVFKSIVLYTCLIVKDSAPVPKGSFRHSRDDPIILTPYPF